MSENQHQNLGPDVVGEIQDCSWGLKKKICRKAFKENRGFELEGYITAANKHDKRNYVTGILLIIFDLYNTHLFSE